MKVHMKIEINNKIIKLCLPPLNNSSLLAVSDNAIPSLELASMEIL